MEDINTLAINEVFVNLYLVGIIQYILDKIRYIFSFLQYTIISINPLSIYSSCCNPGDLKYSNKT